MGAVRATSAKTVKSWWRGAAIVFSVALAGILPGAPGASGSSASRPCDGVSPLDPAHRLTRVEPQPAGTERTYCLFSGPYTIPPGHDLSRVDLDLALGDGFLVAGGPGVVLADGTEPSHQDMHIHHAHWWFLQPGAKNYGPSVPFPGWKWISGAGEEETEGSFSLVADANPDPAAPRYGLAVREGERVLQFNMLHNKRTQPFVVWIKVDLTFVHGTAEEIRSATPGSAKWAGKEFRNLTPVLVGGSFDVAKGSGGADGKFVYPYELPGTPTDADGIQPRRGRVWTVPFSGTIVIGAGHLHPGGERVVVTNMGQPGSPCADPVPRADGIPGKTLYELDAITRNGVPFSEDFQIEITQPGFRATVRQGDRIVLNGVYESAGHAWWDAMTHTGFFVDEHPVSDAQACQASVIGTPPGWSPPLGATVTNTWDGVPNREWTGTPDPVCGAEYGGDLCERNLAPAAPGPHTEGVAIASFQFLPGGEGVRRLGVPQVERGKPLQFYNADYLPAGIRHTVTSCAAPCDGTYVANYPLPDGTFDSGFLGWEPTTCSGVSCEWWWTLQTGGLTPGRYTYFCRIHPWMRGALDIVAPQPVPPY